MGLGAAIIGFVLKRPAAKIVFYIIAIITVLVGVLMLPVDLIWKIVLIALEALMIGSLILKASRKVA